MLARPQDAATQLVILPTEPGESRAFAGQGTEYYDAAWSAGGEKLLLTGRSRRS